MQYVRRITKRNSIAKATDFERGRVQPSGFALRERDEGKLSLFLLDDYTREHLEDLRLPTPDGDVAGLVILDETVLKSVAKDGMIVMDEDPDLGELGKRHFTIEYVDPDVAGGPQDLADHATDMIRGGLGIMLRPFVDSKGRTYDVGP